MYLVQSNLTLSSPGRTMFMDLENLKNFQVLCFFENGRFQ